jgi:hypothetical protein
MLLDLLRTITDFISLVTRFITEKRADEQRMALVDQFVQLDGLEAAFQFKLRDLLMMAIAILIIIFLRAWVGQTVVHISDSNRAPTPERRTFLVT